MVELRHIAETVVRDEGFGAEYVVPVPDKFIGPVSRHRPTGYSGQPRIKIDDVRTARLWSGSPEYQTASGWGH